MLNWKIKIKKQKFIDRKKCKIMSKIDEPKYCGNISSYMHAHDLAPIVHIRHLFKGYTSYYIVPKVTMQIHTNLYKAFKITNM